MISANPDHLEPAPAGKSLAKTIRRLHESGAELRVRVPDSHNVVVDVLGELGDDRVSATWAISRVELEACLFDLLDDRGAYLCERLMRAREKAEEASP